MQAHWNTILFFKKLFLVIETKQHTRSCHWESAAWASAEMMFILLPPNV